MDKRRVAHALESARISDCFERHARLAESKMAEYREYKGMALSAALRRDYDSRDQYERVAFAARREARSIMFPYRQEFKFRAWCLNEATAETKVDLVYGEC